MTKIIKVDELKNTWTGNCPLPPVDWKHPEIRTPAEQEAWNRYELEVNKYFNSLFSFEQLQEIVSIAKAPPLKRSIDASLLISSVACGIHNKSTTPDTSYKKTLKKEKVIRKSWATLRKHIEEKLKEPTLEIPMGFDQSINVNLTSEIQNLRTNKLKSFLKSMDSVENSIFIERAKRKGEHGGIAVTHNHQIQNFFQSLTWAFEESGENKVSLEKRYLIVQALLQKMGVHLTMSSVKSVLTKTLKDKPWILDKKAYEDYINNRRTLAMKGIVENENSYGNSIQLYL